MFKDWIDKQQQDIQLIFFNKLSHFLSNNEIVSVMNQVADGVDIADAHIKMGLIEKYRVEIFKLRQWITDKYPNRVID
ncbi:hypothetical protein EW093_09005 [Thiospirochaeta perfilievii]|uniref:Uncharacterized protein n=1 Tax=Thiospirochaeta perfilievii TaxID=252967 RepID=A0A5C1Q9V8_9SPIO|nr:hypothetical protein [Thiospirochaeta perfilievii]QEN04835.1 hypothetical protein EW093_09005 [Thiospirochaeta perfilievii]